jgi:hypothetical protein
MTDGHEEPFLNVTWINHLSAPEVFTPGIDRRGHAPGGLAMKESGKFPLAPGLLKQMLKLE